MKITGPDRSLESFKIFPFVSWGLVIVFSLFVYNITTRLDHITNQLDEQTKYIQEQANKKPNEQLDLNSSQHKTK